MSAKLSIYRGTTYNFTYNHTDSTGAVVALTGCTIYFTVKSALYDTDIADSSAVIKKTITSHTNAAGGVSGWTLSDVDTYVEPGKYNFTVIVENAAHQSDPPSLIGSLTILPQQTNRQVSNG